MSCEYDALFNNDELFNSHFDRALRRSVSYTTPVCNHEATEESVTFDENKNEKVCKHCGQVFETEITEYDKLSGCLDGEAFLNVRYGPSTPTPLQSFLLPTLAKGVKCRDKFVDIEHLVKTRKYTDIQRLCQQYHIPNDYAIEVMRRLLKSGKDLHSKYRHIEILISLVEDNPILVNRVKELRRLTREGVRIEKYMEEIERLKAELEAERAKSLNIRVTLVH